MRFKNSVELRIWGRYALFSEPITRVGGEKCSYPVPTYEALKGILESCYWKPTFIWHPDSVRIINTIETESKGTRPIRYNDGNNDLSYYTYLVNVEYRLRAHFEWNEHRPDLAGDRDENKHFFIARRMIERGGRRDIYLGARECQGYVEPCVFDEGKSDYEGMPDMPLGLMLHGFTYPDEGGDGVLKMRLWRPVMHGGTIDFCRPEDCPVVEQIAHRSWKTFTSGKNFSPVTELAKEVGYDGLD